MLGSPLFLNTARYFCHYVSDYGKKNNMTKDRVVNPDANVNSSNTVVNEPIEEGWQNVVNRRNAKEGGWVMNKYRQGSFGGYGSREGMNGRGRGAYNNRGKVNPGNYGCEEC